ncbi:serine hydrolase [Dietzia sp. 179-F 9C3 NHS]|uniref:serine hydrolase n=1 Tax=Dietzia sp. 179-F 9C3 NHS TaxID=3374295 RepID=UPI003879A908
MSSRPGLSSRGARRVSRRPSHRALRVLAAAVTVPLLVTACGGAPPKPGADESPYAYSGVGVDDDRIDYAIGKVETIVEEEREASGVPGVAVAVVHRGETVYAKGFGTRGAAGDAPVDGSTVFPLGALSTPVSATVAAATFADAELDWSTPVRDVLPEFALADPRVTPMVTLGDLFAHRSGLPAHAGVDLADLGLDRGEVIDRLRHLPSAPLRTTHAYAEGGVTAAAEAVARSAGTPWAELADERLFAPLGMDGASYVPDAGADPGDDPASGDRATYHVRAGDAADGAWTPAPGHRTPAALAPARGAFASVTDMARWTAMVMADGRAPGGAEVVPPAALREALSPQSVAVPPATAADRPGAYGYGFALGTTSAGRALWGHPGTVKPGAGASVLVLPSLELGIVTLTNAGPVGLAETINSRFADHAQFGDPTLDWGAVHTAQTAALLAPVGDLVGQRPPADPEESRPLDQLTGDYRNPYYGTLRVRCAGETLTLETGRGLGPTELTHWDADTFAAEGPAASPTGSTWPAGSRGSVTFDDDEVRVDLLDRAGQGTFTRIEDAE